MIAFYKPNSKNSGCALSIAPGYSDNKLYFSFLKQHSWDQKTKKGSFSQNRNRAGYSTILKFNRNEAGDVIHAIETFTEIAFFHTSESFSSKISFGPSNDGTHFKLSVTQMDSENKSASYFIPLSCGEARVIKEYLIHFLHKSFRQVAQQQIEQQPKSDGLSSKRPSPKQSQPTQPEEEQNDDQEPPQSEQEQEDEPTVVNEDEAENHADW